jgi:dipeptidyl aminopeptidase/acylaminoacyl peptidase
VNHNRSGITVVMLLVANSWSLLGGFKSGAPRRDASQAKRLVTAADTVEMTRVAGDAHYDNSPPYPPLVYFSPGGGRFVVVLRRGNLSSNMNDYSMLLFEAAAVFGSPKPVILVKMSNASNEDAIRHIRWSNDETLLFLGEQASDSAQIFRLNVRSRKINRLTNHRGGILDYRIADTGKITFLATAPSSSHDKTSEQNGTVISEQEIDTILTGEKVSENSANLFSITGRGREARLVGNKLENEQPLPGQDSPKPNREVSTAAIIVSVEEDFNTPQRLYATDTKTSKKVMLLDLNPQFMHLDFAKIELVTWKGTDGKQELNGGGLYYPPGYIPGRKYPLVIQTHHFQKDLFMIDGPWASGYAAQALAAKGFIVLQVHHATGYYDHTPTEAASEAAMYEGAIDYLDGLGLIDRSRIGIYAFSRTVYHVGYALTHSKYHFAAAILEDGIDGGYFQYLLYPWGPDEYDKIYGGSPYGETHGQWRKEAPGFNLDKVDAPIRIMEHGRSGILQQWEWFSGLKRLHRPVDMVVLPNSGYGEHLLKKPREQIIDQQGTVDWFCFWLEGEQNADPDKAVQYMRWKGLQSQLKSSQNNSSPVSVH